MTQLSLQRLDFNRLVTTIVFIAVFVMALRYPMGHDSWWHLRSGQYMVETGSLIQADPFSHTQNGQPWINHGWLAQLLWYSLFSIGGLSFLSLGLAIIVTYAFWLTWQQTDANVYTKAFLIILAAIPASIIWSVRPQMISFLLTAIISWLLYRFKYQRKSLLPWLPLLMVVWVNSHGGFAIGFILLTCYLVGELFNAFLPHSTPEPDFIGWTRWRHLLLASVITLFVVVINPHTWRMWLYPFQTVGIGVLRDFIAEWQSPNFHQPIVQSFLVLVLVMIAVLARTKHPMDWTDLALLGGWTTLSFFAVRNVPIFALVCTPILTRYTQYALDLQFGAQALGRPRRYSRIIYKLNVALLGFTLLGAVGQAIITLSPTTLDEREQIQFPVEATQFIAQTNPATPIFNSYNIGGYLIYHLWPDYPVFVDGRTDLYEDAFLRTYLATINALPGWQNALNQANIQTVIIENQSPLAFALASQADWQQTFSSDKVVIFERQAQTR
ncbi:MAG: hypothetical protein AAF629_23685 [Chloroflexota bacterium]